MTSNRWIILAVLFLARVSMAFQFQSVAALSPLITNQFGVGLADIGFLIGLYFAPGVVFALPGGAVASRFGDKRIVGIGLALMVIGAIIIATTKDWTVFAIARLIVGVGGVILNVVMTKMLVDWFAGHEIATAMAIFINSWPIGIAVALLVLPPLAQAGGIALAWWVLAGFVGCGFLVFTALYRPPPNAPVGAGTIEKVALPLAALISASLVWAFYNTALAMVFSFGPAFLIQQGYALTEAGSVVSLFMVIFSLALPVGGVIADRTGRKDTIILISLVGFALLMPVAVFVPATAFTVFCLLGAVFAIAAGPIMTLPSEILAPQSRAVGMGVFFTVYYALMMIGPRIGGGIAEAQADPGAAIIVGAVMSAIAAVCLLGFRGFSRA